MLVFLSLSAQSINKDHVLYLHHRLHLRHHITNRIGIEPRNDALIRHDLDHHHFIKIAIMKTTVVTNQIHQIGDDDNA